MLLAQSCKSDISNPIIIIGVFAVTKVKLPVSLRAYIRDGATNRRAVRCMQRPLAALR